MHLGLANTVSCYGGNEHTAHQAICIVSSPFAFDDQVICNIREGNIFDKIILTYHSPEVSKSQGYCIMYCPIVFSAAFPFIFGLVYSSFVPEFTILSIYKIRIYKILLFAYPWWDKEGYLTYLIPEVIRKRHSQVSSKWHLMIG